MMVAILKLQPHRNVEAALNCRELIYLPQPHPVCYPNLHELYGQQEED